MDLSIIISDDRQDEQAHSGGRRPQRSGVLAYEQNGRNDTTKPLLLYLYHLVPCFFDPGSVFLDFFLYALALQPNLSVALVSKPDWQQLE